MKDDTTPPQAIREAARVWLERCPAVHRGTIANWFHTSVRRGAQTESAVLAAVRGTIAQRLHAPASHTWEESALLLLRERLATEQADALTYARQVIDYEALPRAEQRRLKAARAAPYWDTVRQSQPATKAQLNYLAILGHRAPAPLTKAEASARIEALLHQREAPL